MSNNNNIFCATNPAKIVDALWTLMVQSGVDIADMLIFLPSRRAVRTVEKMIVEKSGGAAILPMLVALGEGVDDPDEEDAPVDADVITNTQRIVLMARLLAADSSVGNYTTALTLAHDLVRMQDYLENEGVDATQIDWGNLVDEKYARHFQNKARFLEILSSFMADYAGGKITSTMARNREIRNWVNYLDRYKLVIVCASTASVPATADLMVEIANKAHGRIILSGKISGRVQDFELNTNPYNAEYKFLKRLGLEPDDVQPIDVGPSNIDFMNWAFGNDCGDSSVSSQLPNCHLVEVPREATEASAVAEIAYNAIQQGKSVLVITPDAAGNQRIAVALDARGIKGDFSGGVPGTMTQTGRAILNILDGWIENNSSVFDDLYATSGYNLFDTIAKIVELYQSEFMPSFKVDDATSVQIWLAIKDVSDALDATGVRLSLVDARAFVSDAISTVSVRGVMDDSARVVVLGTIESRMQTADVVILTGLNDGMFPARGYENAWLPWHLANKIGLPSPDRKVSLQALDFMNLSCGQEVWWLRSTVSGGVQTTESRFVSRVIAHGGKFDENKSVLSAVQAQDKVPMKSLDYSVPTPPADWSDVYVTELELLIHNPYAFYVRHILKLRVLDDYWVGVDARDFGNLVHKVIEDAKDWNPDVLKTQMEEKAREVLGENSVLFHFWKKRFNEIAPVVSDCLKDIENPGIEEKGSVKIAGRNVCAKADRFWDGVVLDIKTGAAPTKSQLEKGNMPQLPLEAYILQQGGFPIQVSERSKTPVMKFLQLKNNDVRVIEYDSEKTAEMMRIAIDKTTELFNIYSAGGAGYEYHETGDQKYKIYDDLARVRD